MKRKVSIPLHVEVLQNLQKKVADRQRAHEKKAGKGLPHDEYWKHVGRISEAEVLLADIADLLKRLRSDDDLDEESST